MLGLAQRVLARHQRRRRARRARRAGSGGGGGGGDALGELGELPVVLGVGLALGLAPEQADDPARLRSMRLGRGRGQG